MTGLNITPPPELRTHIRAIQYMDLPPTTEGFAIPAQGRSTLILPEHTEYSLDGEIADRVSIQAATVIGPHDTVIVNHTDLPVRGFTVDFTPLGAAELLGIPQGEIANRGVPADELLSPLWVRELIERVRDAHDVPSALSAIYDLLRRVPLSAGPLPETTLVRRALANSTSTPHSAETGVRRMAEHLGVSTRHLNREFNRHLGMGPRRYSLIRKIQAAMTIIAEGRAGCLSSLALDLGFFDYAHFSNEFKRSTLSTPSGFAASSRHREYQVVAATPRPL